MTLVYPGPRYERLADDMVRLDPTDRTQFDRLFDDTAGQFAGIVDLWPTAAGGNIPEEAATLGWGAALHLVQAIVGKGVDTPPALTGNTPPALTGNTHPALWFVTRGAQPAGAQGGNLAGVAQSPLLGLAKVAALEHPELRCVCVDLDAADHATAARDLFDEIRRPAGEDQIALRAGRRHVARLVRQPPVSGHTGGAVRPDATYLITGGLRGLGLATAAWLVESGARSLVLLGRGAPDAATMTALSDMRSAGADVEAVQADVADAGGMAALLAHIDAELPPLRGVIHAAGVLDDGILAHQTAERFRRVLAPKLLGAWHLHRLTADRTLDFFVLYSSLASLIGSAGQANHAAANAFLDALAHHRRGLGLPGLSINWGVWSEIGAAVRHQVGDRVATQGMGTIAPRQGMRILEHLLFRPVAQVGVMPVDWAVFAARHSARRRPPLFAELIDAAPAPAMSPTVPPPDLAPALRAAPPAERQALLATHLRAQVSRVLRLAPDAVDPHQPLARMGLELADGGRAAQQPARAARDRRAAGAVPGRRQHRRARRGDRPRNQSRYQPGDQPGDRRRHRPWDRTRGPGAGGDAGRGHRRRRIAAGADRPVDRCRGGRAARRGARGRGVMSAGEHRGLSSQEKRALLAALLRDRPQRTGAAAPLSHNQKALWLLHQRAPESSAYNTAFAVRVRSPIAPATLRAALQAIVDRHAALRTTFTAEDGRAVAVTAAHQTLHLAEIDARGWTAERLEASVAADYRQPFDLARGPLLRVSLYACAPDTSVLLLALHHIICDAWSMWLLMHELSVLYPALLEGRPSGLAPVPAQFPEFVAWQDRLLAGPEGGKLWDYWRGRLDGDLPVLELPTDRPRPAAQSANGASHAFQIDAAAARGLLEVGKAHGATLYMVLLAAFQIMLHRCTGQDDIIVGSPAAGRSNPDMATCIGYFANALPLRADLSGDPTFAAFLSQVRHSVLDALTHQDMPFPLLIERLRPKRDPSRAPVIETMFVLQRPPQSEPFVALLTGAAAGRVRWGGLEMEPFPIAQMEGQFDLSWEVVEGPTSLSCVLKYSPDLFEADTIRRMEGHLRTLLQAAAHDPEQRISRMPLLTPAERTQVIEQWQGPAVPYRLDHCLHHWIEDQAVRTPDAVAVTLAAPGGGALTWRELDARANRLARRLQRLGIASGSVIGVLAERSPALVVGLLGILKAGCA